MTRALLLAIVVTLLAPAVAASALTPTTPKPSQKIKDGNPEFTWTLEEGEQTHTVVYSRQRATVTGWNEEPLPSTLPPSETYTAPTKLLPAGTWYWRVIGAIADRNPADEDGDLCFDQSEGCDNSATVDYLPSAMWTFKVPTVLKNFHSERWWFRYQAQEVDIPVVFWTNADDALVELTARTAQRTYWRDARGPGSTPYAKNRRKFTWDISGASCRHPMWVVAKVTAGGKTITRRSKTFTWKCGTS